MGRKIILSAITCLIYIASCTEENPQQETLKNEKDIASLEVLLLGTFHFRNFDPNNNGDLVATQIPDVLTNKNQKELEKIAQHIVNFKPDKIFVEYPYSKQKQLDSIYSAFPEQADFKYQNRNETNQIAFRVAKQLGHNSLYGIDIRTEFPYDSLLRAMKKANQTDLIQKDEEELNRLEKNGNELFSSDKNLSELIFYFNEPGYRKSDINWYVNLANQAGDMDDFVGVHLASEWYKRNLYMYSIIQKTIQKSDEKIMILGGASHIGMFNEFIKYTPEWKTTELKEIIK